MRWLKLMFRSLLRSRRRTLLTTLSLAVSVALVAILQGVLATLDGFAHNPDASSRLVVRHAVSVTNWLPGRYEDWIRRQPEVQSVLAMQWFGGIYKDPKNFFPSFGIEPEPLLRVFKEELGAFPAGQFAAFLGDPNGCAVGQALMDKYGWRLGQVITLQGKIYPLNPRLTIRGTWRSRRKADEQALYFHWKLVEAAFPACAGLRGSFWVRARSPADVPRLIERIDRHFASAIEPTRSETENVFQLTFLRMMGDYAAILDAITAAVMAAILIVTANTMAMAIRERTREIAVLRAMGFTASQVLSLLMSEGLLLALAGGALGLLFSLAAAEVVRRSAGAMLPYLAQFTIGQDTVLRCLWAALLLGLLATFIPAYRAVRRPIVEGLRAVD